MRINFLLVVIFCCCNCNNSREEATEHLGKPYFDFDHVIHFKAEATELQVESLLTKTNATKKEKHYVEVIAGEYPNKLKDIDTNKLVKLSYKKTHLNSSAISEIRRIFTNKAPSDGIAMSCMPVYRDIFVFVKAKQITGVAKICFTCHQYYMIGEQVSTESFGSDRDFEDLSKVIDY